MSTRVNLPERVLQFGTGILLRRLPDYFIDKANKQGIFNGKILVVKSTPGGVGDFQSQNCSFATYVRGIENGEFVQDDFTNEAISRVISANDHWQEIIKEAANPDL